MEEGIFEKMLEPFDPTLQDEDRKVRTQPAGKEENEEEEATQPKVTVAPTQPSREEVEKHMATHLPYRSWCPHCVRGKSGSKPHKVNQGKGAANRSAAAGMEGILHQYKN